MQFSSPRIITDDTYHYSSGYFTTNKFLSTGEMLLVRSVDPSIGTKADSAPCEIVACRPATGELRYLATGIDTHAFATACGNTVYYSTGHELMKLDALSGEQQVLFRTASEQERLCEPHITKDGQHISFRIADNAGAHIYVYHLSTQTAEHYCDKVFATPFTEADHVMISPTDPTKVFFAHEGITYYISNRLWLYDHQTGEAHAIAHQNMDEEGNLGDCFGHEMWAPDGKSIYFVKYPCSPTPPRGICSVDIATREIKLLYSAYNYWHVGVSQDGRYLTADTQPTIPGSEVIVIDRQTGTEQRVAVADITWVHPCHPHPQLSPDDRYLVYTALNEQGRTCVYIYEMQND